MAAPNPFDHPDFILLRTMLIRNIDADRIRQQSFAKRLISRAQSDRLAAISGNHMEHNELFLSLIRPGGTAAFQVLSALLAEYTEIHELCESILRSCNGDPAGEDKENSVSATKEKPQVMFSGVKPRYLVGSPISIILRLTVDFAIASCDWIGIYPAGFQSAYNDYLSFEWCSNAFESDSEAEDSSSDTDDDSAEDSCEKGFVQRTVRFPAHVLPKTDSPQEYEIAYVRQRETVLCRSSRFQIRNHEPPPKPMVSLEGEEGFICPTAQTDVERVQRQMQGLPLEDGPGAETPVAASNPARIESPAMASQADPDAAMSALGGRAVFLQLDNETPQSSFSLIPGTPSDHHASLPTPTSNDPQPHHESRPERAKSPVGKVSVAVSATPIQPHHVASPVITPRMKPGLVQPGTIDDTDGSLSRMPPAVQISSEQTQQARPQELRSPTDPLPQEMEDEGHHLESESAQQSVFVHLGAVDNTAHHPRDRIGFAHHVPSTEEDLRSNALGSYQVVYPPPSLDHQNQSRVPSNPGMSTPNHASQPDVHAADLDGDSNDFSTSSGDSQDSEERMLLDVQLTNPSTWQGPDLVHDTPQAMAPSRQPAVHRSKPPSSPRASRRRQPSPAEDYSSNHELQRQLSDRDARIRALEAENASLRRDRDLHMEKNITLNAKHVEEKRRMRGDMERREEQLAQEKDDMKRQLKQLQREQRKASRAATAATPVRLDIPFNSSWFCSPEAEQLARTHLAHDREEKSQLAAELEATAKELAQVDALRQAMEKRMTTLDERHQRNQEEKSALRETLATLEREKQKLLQDVSTAMHNTKKAEDHIEKLKHHISKSKNMRRSLEAENKALAERVTEIGEELRQMTEIQDAGRQRIRSLLVPLVSRIQTVCMAPLTHLSHYSTLPASNNDAVVRHLGSMKLTDLVQELGKAYAALEVSLTRELESLEAEKSALKSQMEQNQRRLEGIRRHLDTQASAGLSAAPTNTERTQIQQAPQPAPRRPVPTGPGAAAGAATAAAVAAAASSPVGSSARLSIANVAQHNAFCEPGSRADGIEPPQVPVAGLINPDAFIQRDLSDDTAALARNPIPNDPEAVTGEDAGDDMEANRHRPPPPGLKCPMCEKQSEQYPTLAMWHWHVNNHLE